MKPATWKLFVTKGRRRRVQVSSAVIAAGATAAAGVALFVTLFMRRHRNTRRLPFFAVV